MAYVDPVWCPRCRVVHPPRCTLNWTTATGWQPLYVFNEVRIDPDDPHP